MLFWKCEDAWVSDTIKSLVLDYHPTIAVAKIGVIFKEKAGGDSENPVYATSSKVSNKQKVLGIDYDFIIEIGADVWQELDDQQKTAVIFHELCHMKSEEDDKTGELKYYITNHDVNEFRSVIEKYGFWNDGLKKMGNSVANIKE